MVHPSDIIRTRFMFARVPRHIGQRRQPWKELPPDLSLFLGFQLFRFANLSLNAAILPIEVLAETPGIYVQRFQNVLIELLLKRLCGYRERNVVTWRSYGCASRSLAAVG